MGNIGEMKLLKAVGSVWKVSRELEKESSS
jgi:hypothetical protein